ncbi:hypothetical protein BDN67DRAFT_663818 [Paxillus ammoniavirescens]|nr:hypothetical protein BDN67DRAFT_663818 [Paxillus ammoniavirescens]
MPLLRPVGSSSGSNYKSVVSYTCASSSPFVCATTFKPFFLAFPPMPASFALIWAPMFLGYSVALASYGATVGQFVYYVRAFPDDRRLLKILVFIVLCVDNFHSYS